ncbi:hypothetical protein ACFX13_001515 [Malus domestica]
MASMTQSPPPVQLARSTTTVIWVDAFATQPAWEAFSPPSIYAESNGQGIDGGFGGSDDPILPPPSEMPPEEGFALSRMEETNLHMPVPTRSRLN